ncbi:hypothetical protein [Flavobacterium sp.]|uniref:hypothetical protein n=1 Tax=Flavobacterium sp. TaxID=239 RepID=UPI0026362E0E|nr:hypothetical protein [Flavobacterium sp.]
MDWKLKIGLFVVSVAGFMASAYFLLQDIFVVVNNTNDLIYLSLLVLLLCNSLIGIIIAMPENFSFLKKIKLLGRGASLRRGI